MVTAGHGCIAIAREHSFFSAGALALSPVVYFLYRRLDALAKVGGILCLFSASIGWAQVSVLTGQYNLGRTNANQSETILTTANVTKAGFGLLYSLALDGQAYAQPLVVSGIAIQGQTRNVAYAATMHNTVYAFDVGGATASAPLWQKNLGPSAPFDYPELGPECGVLSTPVIDPTSSTLYVVALTLENGISIYRLHALDLATGAEKFNGPVVIQATVKGTGFDSLNGVVTFSAANELQRPALLLFANTVFIGFGTASPAEPVRKYHGWMLGYDAAKLTLKFAYNTTANGGGGGIWMSGVGPAADANGFYFVSGNGSLGSGSTSESVVRLGGATTDYFIPDDWQMLNQDDWDLGASGALLAPGTNWLVVGGKTGMIYVLQRTNLGHLTQGNTGAVQSFSATAGCPSGACNEVHHMTYWYRTSAPPLLYVWGWNDVLKAYAAGASGFNTIPAATNSSVTPNFPGGILALSSNGGTNGILWAVTSTQNAMQQVSPGVLHAYDASNVATELWNSSMNPGDNLGTMAKFSVPTIANGKVFVGTFSNQLMVYGLH